MRRAMAGLLFVLFAFTVPAMAQVSVRVGINIPTYPTLVPVPGYPVYYAPSLDANYFFYDGLYWYFDGDRWYESSWYNGPWYYVDPFDVPVYVLRVPVRYYRHPPAYFRAWAHDSAPRWGERWGRTWETRRSGWDRWDRRSAPTAAPLPHYQQQYAGSRYPQPTQQAQIQSRSYDYQPRESVTRQHYQQQRAQAQAPAAQLPQQQSLPGQAAFQQQRDGLAQQRAAAQQQMRQDQQREIQQQRQEQRQEQRGERGQGQGRGRGHENDG